MFNKGVRLLVIRITVANAWFQASAMKINLCSSWLLRSVEY